MTLTIYGRAAWKARPAASCQGRNARITVPRRPAAAPGAHQRHPQPEELTMREQTRVRATDVEVHRLYVALSPFARSADPALRITPAAPRLATQAAAISAQPRPERARG